MLDKHTRKRGLPVRFARTANAIVAFNDALLVKIDHTLMDPAGRNP